MATEKRLDCPMRHENGNCLPAGGFCTAVNHSICEALHNAFNHGEQAGTERVMWESLKQNGIYQQKQLESLREIYKTVSELPTNSVVVVRCKDCKYYDACELTCELLFNPCATNVAWYPEDFCSYGERRTDG